MKKQLYTIGFLLLFLLVSCFRDKTVTIGFLLPNLTDGRYPKDRDYFVEKVSRLGGKVEIGDAHNDPDLQEEQARQMIEKGVKILVICAVNQNLAASMVRFAHEHKVKVIAYERLIQNCDLDYFVAFDHYIVGKQQASNAVQHKPQGNYVLIGGDKRDKNAELIKKGQVDVLEPFVKSGKIKVIYNVFIEDWDATGAYNEMDKVLHLCGEKIDVVLSANDGMAEGVIKALEENQPGYPVIVTGLDADIAACRRIVKGKQTMTVYKPFKKQAEITAELAINVIKNKNIRNISGTTFNGTSNIQTITLQSIVVDSVNIRNTIINDGYLKASDVFIRD
ncbi:MAG TPA: substrate-binding domain-containing protein [Bacteroidales bacterium]